MLISIIHLFFLTYTILLALRIIGSWFPSVAKSPPMAILATFVDPYLGLIRRVVPPINGVFDLSPMIGYLLLQVMEHLFLKLC